MRIIAGLFKSRKIYSPVTGNNNKPGDIRPTSDRARETVFDILNNRFDFSGFSCLDLFAGTGAFGFECLSRGAGFVNFVDYSGVFTGTKKVYTRRPFCVTLGVNFWISRVFTGLPFTQMATK